MMTRNNVRISVILDDKKRFSKIVRSPAGKVFTEKGVDAILEKEAELVEKFFPGREFRLIPLARGAFNFVEVAKEATAG